MASNRTSLIGHAAIAAATAILTATGPAASAQPGEQEAYPIVQSRIAEHFECMTPPVQRSFNDREWPGGFVPFAFDPDLSSTERQHMRQSMDWWTTTTGVKFVYRINETAYIYVTRSPDANISWSREIGRDGSVQNVEIADSHWDDHGVIAHELCHALGWFHEQARPDRDFFITIEDENIEEGRASQFAIQDDSLTLGNPYDYESIMHYRACSFSVCDDCDPGDANCRTITTLDSDWQDGIGQRDHLSAGDILDVCTVYGQRTARYVRLNSRGDGRLSSPYGAISSAFDVIPDGGYVLIEGGTYPQAGTYTKASIWRAHGSTVRVQ